AAACLDDAHEALPVPRVAPSCAHCGRPTAEDGERVMACARCKRVSYCSKEHQRLHWPAHKPSCTA
ncbi:hypothetical protein M885DRAFT_453990, partial [Pelagophyceae sp. CCMP2097]